MIAKDGEIVDF
jgi:dynein heavy chain, axonemal